MSEIDVLNEIDQEINICLESISYESLIVQHIKDIEDKLKELRISDYQLTKKYNELLKKYDKFEKFNLPNIISDFINQRFEEKQEAISQEFLQTSLLCTSVAQDIEVHLFEKRILEEKASAIHRDKMLLQVLIDKKEEIIKNSAQLNLSAYSTFTLRTNKINRKLKSIVQLHLDGQNINDSIDSLRLGLKEITIDIDTVVSNFQKFYPTYYQNKKIKWIARKSIQLKLEMERYVFDMRKFIDAEGHKEIEKQTNNYIHIYIENLVQDLKNHRLRPSRVDYFFQNLTRLIIGIQNQINENIKTGKAEILEIDEEKRQWLIEFGQ